MAATVFRSLSRMGRIRTQFMGALNGVATRLSSTDTLFLIQRETVATVPLELPFRYHSDH